MKTLNISSRGPRAAEAFTPEKTNNWLNLLHIEVHESIPQPGNRRSSEERVTTVARVLIEAVSPETLMQIEDGLTERITMHVTIPETQGT